MPDGDLPDTITLTCRKTGREYDAPLRETDGDIVVDATCPYCETRGMEAVIDDIRRDLEDIDRRLTDDDDE